MSCSIKKNFNFFGSGYAGLGLYDLKKVDGEFVYKNNGNRSRGINVAYGPNNEGKG